ncbi:hypothetical protein J2S69_004663 [Glycomyces lechevalierae]|uniref:Uncharacterized protein n=1 Tax=Glycomyces lechevalierae TaxID=256034 RepID=A0ABU2AUR1_9ACTN|nr:hypothetical protein [Glycomyces lechevalierae]
MTRALQDTAWLGDPIDTRAPSAQEHAPVLSTFEGPASEKLALNLRPTCAVTGMGVVSSCGSGSQRWGGGRRLRPRCRDGGRVRMRFKRAATGWCAGCPRTVAVFWTVPGKRLTRSTGPVRLGRSGEPTAGWCGMGCGGREVRVGGSDGRGGSEIRRRDSDDHRGGDGDGDRAAAVRAAAFAGPLLPIKACRCQLPHSAVQPGYLILLHLPSRSHNPDADACTDQRPRRSSPPPPDFTWPASP